MNKSRIAYLQLHIAVLLYGLTAILGDLISISAVSLVWWRVLITSCSLLFFVGFGKKIIRLPPKTILCLLGIGVIVALHWMTFYGSIKLANASVALAAMATTSLYTSIIEPIITGKKFQWLEFGLGLLIIPPMLMIASNLDLSLMQGLYVGLLSAFLAALFATLNKKMVDAADAYEVSFLEMSSACLFITILLPFIIRKDVSFMPVGMDWVYLIILALGCTTIAFVICMKALKHVSAFDANLVINLEPVYGILLAIIILKEHKEMTPTFYLGMVLKVPSDDVHGYQTKNNTRDRHLYWLWHSMSQRGAYSRWNDIHNRER